MKESSLTESGSKKLGPKKSKLEKFVKESVRPIWAVWFDQDSYSALALALAPVPVLVLMALGRRMDQ